MDSRADCISSARKVLAISEKTTTRRTRSQINVKILLRTVKLTAFFILLACLHLSAKTTAQKLSISLKNGSLESLFATIEQKTGFSVFYNAIDLQHSKPVTIDVKDASVEEVLQLSLKGQALTYFIQEKTIFIKKEVARTVSDAAGPGDAAPNEFSGTVKSEAGTPLVGATVFIRKLKKSAVTDSKGEFTLKNVPDGEYEVEISYIGFETYTIKITVVKHGAALTAALKQSMSKLDETVVKGYYNTTERLNTGDVTTVKGETINEQPVTDPILALEGRVPGLYIQQTSGAPGAYSTIRIMGQNSIANGNDPLYVVDGVPFSSVSLSSTSMTGGAIPMPGSNISNTNGGGLSPFNNLNPADIESIEVLKDADATAIYGSRGANGVILIMTKRGKAGATRLDMNLYSGAGQVTRMMPMLNTSQYLEMRREAFKNDGLAVPSITTTPTDNNYDIDGLWDTTRYTNWQKVLIGNAANFTNAQASVSGGSPNTQFVIGGGYSKQGTAFIGNFSDQKVSARVSLTHASTDQRFHLQMGANYVYDNNDLPSTDFTSSITLVPDAPALYNGKGNLNWAIYNGTATFSNPANPAAVTLQSSKAASNSLISNLNLSYQILPGLQLKSGFGYNKGEMNQTYLEPSAAVAPPSNTNPLARSMNFANTTFTTWIIEPQLNYQRTMGLGRIEALVGSTFQQNIHNSLTQYAYGFASDALITDPLAASNVGLYGDNYSLYRYNAIYGRLGYNFDDKYIANFTARRDGSSRFGPGKQFGNFGAVGIGWIFSKETFFADKFSLLSFGKLRASYGITGNDQITDYQYLSTYTPDGYTYEGNGGGLHPNQLTNPYFAWEVDKKLQAGLDLGFLKDRILVSGTYYRNRTENQLVGEPLPEVTGFTTVQYNLPAVVQNSGMELTVNTINIRSNGFKWTTSVNLTVPSNKLVAFPGISNTNYAYSLAVGKSLFIRRVYHWTGVNPQTGLYSFATKNANGMPSAPQDWVVNKPVTQKFYGGMQNNFSYKGFQLDIFIQYVNQLGYNYQNSIPISPGYVNLNQPTAVLSRWTRAGDLSAIERFSTTSANFSAYYGYSSLLQSDAVITNASFLRLKNLALSYSLPGSWKDHLHLQNVRIYLQCQNLFTITNYAGLDPEVGGLSLPPLRMITAGLQVDL
jgi:TonB-dependent starch-binding outer membrane protein SusC